MYSNGFRRAAITIVAILSIAAIMTGGRVLADTIFVNNVEGHDHLNGKAPQLGDGKLSGPVRTIGHAIAIARPADAIVLARTDEPYRESITLFGIDRSGDQSSPFVLYGNGAILDGSAPVPDDAWEHVAKTVYRFHPSRVSHQQLFIDGKPLERVDIDRGAENPPELEPMQWCLLGGYVYFSTDPMKRPEDYAISCASRQTGITLFHVNEVRIIELTVQGFQLDGINAFNSAYNILLENVKCRGNGRAGLCVGGASNVALQGCVLGDNGEAQLLTLPLSEVLVRDSELIPNTAPNWLSRGGQVTIVDSPEEVPAAMPATTPTTTPAP